MKRYAGIAMILALVVGFGAVFEVRHIEEVCSLTGSSQRFKRYFSFFSTTPVISKSWIEEALTSDDQPVPDYLWVRTMDTTWRLIGTTREHEGPPITYHARSMSLDLLRQIYTNEEILVMAHQFVSGNQNSQQKALDTLQKGSEDLPKRLEGDSAL